MTIKLVQTYRDLDTESIEGENIRKVRQEIEETLDTINDAYERLYGQYVSGDSDGRFQRHQCIEDPAGPGGADPGRI